MKLGDRAEVTRTYTPEMVATFAGLAGCDAATISHVPEPLIAALFSYLLGVKLPGAGTNYLKQDMGFIGAAEFGEALTASVEVTRIRPEKHLVDLETVCRGADGRQICIGRALVLVKDVGIPA